MTSGSIRVGWWQARLLAGAMLLAVGASLSAPASAAPAPRESNLLAPAAPRDRSRARTRGNARRRARARGSRSGAASATAAVPSGVPGTAPAPGAAITGTPVPGIARVSARIVEVAGGRAYLAVAPGANQRVRVGDQVHIGSRRYPVLAANAKHIVIATGRGRLVPGSSGEVVVRLVAPQTFATRPPPRPLSVFTGRWLPPPLPADSQRPRFVPLGVMSDQRHNRAAFVLDHQRIEPLSGPAASIGRTRLRALLHAELSSVPLTLDADAFAEFWQASDLDLRRNNESRPFITVRQLELGYHGETLQGSVGRLRYAARSLGSLDGARVSASFNEAWSVAAFGGTLANPLDGNVSTDASRFGAEVAWQDARASWQPRGSLTLHGSRYLGRTDERRLTALLESFPKFGHLGARAEVSLFDSDNPWGAATQELTAAGAEAVVRVDALRLGASFDMRQPERSLWLASFLPPGYFCVSEPAPGTGFEEPCLGGDRRYAAALNAAWEAMLWTADVGATFATTRRANADQTTGFVNFRRRELIGKLRLDAGSSLSRGSLYQSAAVNLGTGLPIGDDTADLSFYYRPSWMRYRSEPDGFVEHGFGTRVWWALSPVFDLSGSADVLTGRDVDVLVFQLSAAYRPRF
jgi:hypothetical protein